MTETANDVGKTLEPIKL